MSAAPKLLIISAIVALSIGAHACGGSNNKTPPPAVTSSLTATASPTSTSTPTPTPTPINPEAVLREAGEAMKNVDSFHYRLSHRSGGTALLPNLVLQEAEGDVIKPDKISAEFSGSFGGIAIKSGLITLGEDSYMTNPLTGRWESVPREVSPLGFFNPRKGIASMMEQVDQVSLVPDGKDVYLIRGRLPAEALAPLLGATVKGTTVGVELTIDADEGYLLEAVLDGRVTSTEPEGTVRVITLSKFNEQITITHP